MERTHDEEPCKIINNLLDAVRNKRIRTKNNKFFTNSWRIKIALDSYFEEHAKEVCVRNCMNSEMHATWFNTYPPKLIAMILRRDCRASTRNPSLT